MAARSVRSRFRKDELILCFEPDPKKARVLYEAKILEVRHVRSRSGTKVSEYLIHFNGWSSSWDRRLGEEHLLKLTPENSALAKRLREVARGIRTNNARKRKIDEILGQVFKKGKRRNLEDACVQRGSNAGTETESRSSGNATEDCSSDDDDEGTLSADDESHAASPGGGRRSDHSDAGSNGRIESADGTNSDDDVDDDATTTSSKRQAVGSRQRRQQPHGQRSRADSQAGGRRSSSRNGEEDKEDESRDADEAEEDEEEEAEQTVLYTGPPESAPRLELPLSPNLKKVLAADHHQVRRMAAKRQQQHQQASTLPVQPTVLAILEHFLDDFARHTAPLPSTEVIAAPSSLTATKAPSVSAVRDPLPPCAETRLRLAEEVAEGVRVLFDCTLPLILLYAEERKEYDGLFLACTAEHSDATATTNDVKNQCALPSPSQGGADFEPDAGATAPASALTASLIGRLTRPPISTCTATAAASAAPPPATVTTPVAMPSSPRHCQSVTSTVEARALRHASLRSHGPAVTTSSAVAATGSAAESCGNKDHAMHDLLRRTKAEVNHVHRCTSDNGDCGIDIHHAATTASGTAHGELLSQQLPAAAADVKCPVPDAQQQLLLLPPLYRSSKPPLPCTVYGLPHLLRLLLSLPELVSRMQISPEKCSTVQFILQKLVRFLSEEVAALQPVAASQHHKPVAASQHHN